MLVYEGMTHLNHNWVCTHGTCRRPQLASALVEPLCEAGGVIGVRAGQCKAGKDFLGVTILAAVPSTRGRRGGRLPKTVSLLHRDICVHCSCSSGSSNQWSNTLPLLLQLVLILLQQNVPLLLQTRLLLQQIRLLMLQTRLLLLQPLLLLQQPLPPLLQLLQLLRVGTCC